MRVHFVNENIGGHVTMHRHVEEALARHTDVEATFWDVPRDVFLARAFGSSWPGLSRLDLDLHLVRTRLAQSELVRRHLAELAPLPDVLHLYTQNTGWLSTKTMRRVGTVVSIDASNNQNAYLLPHRRPTRFTPLTVAAGRRWETRVFAAARAIVAHSQWAADAVIASGVPADRMHIVPFGISVRDVVTAARDDGPPRIAFVGLSMERKGGWRLLDLWRRTLRDVSRLVLVTPEHVPPGEGLEVHNDVRQGDGKLERILASADVFVMPGDVDTFGYSILEAMAMGLPVVVPRLAAIPEIVDDGVSGLVVPAGDDYALTTALRRLVLDRAERCAMGEAARQRVREQFDARVTTDALVEILRDAAA